jgi:hypothetical protein
MHCTPNSQAIEGLGERIGEQLKAQISGIVQRVSAEGEVGDGLLGRFEQEVMCAMKAVGASLLTGLCSLLVERYAVAEIKCACGGVAVYQRQREGQTRTLFGDISLQRPYYLCATCHQGRCPLDEELGFCAGGLSRGLGALVALLGTEFVFEDASMMLERLTLVHVSPNTCRKETETLGQLVAADEQATLTFW